MTNNDTPNFERVELFLCPGCKKTHHSIKKATECYQRDIEKIKAELKLKELRDNQADMVRFEAESMPHLQQLLISKAKEYLNVNITFTHFPQTCSKVLTTYAAPIGKQKNWSGSERDDKGNVLPRDYPGWAGKCAGTITGTFVKMHNMNAWEEGIARVFKVFNGFNVHSGIQDRNFDCILNMFIEDFPKIKIKWEEFKALEAQQAIYATTLSTIQSRCRDEVQILPEMQLCDERIRFLNGQVTKARSTMNDLYNREITARVELVKPPIPASFDKYEAYRTGLFASR